MTEGQVFGARRNPARRRSTAATKVRPDYFLDWAFDEMKKLVETFPRSITDRAFVVRTALDPGMQRNAEDAIENQIRQFGRDYHAKQAAAVLADLDGAVRAMVGGVDYNASQFNRATDALRQPGSSFKPYRLRHRADERLQADLGRGRRPRLHRQLVPAELWPFLLGRHHPDPGDHPLDQRHPGEAVDRARQGQRQDRARHDRRDGAPLRHQVAVARHARRCRSAPTRSMSSSTPSPMRLSRTGAWRSRPMRSSRCAPAPARRSGASTATARSRPGRSRKASLPTWPS